MSLVVSQGELAQLIGAAPEVGAQVRTSVSQTSPTNPVTPQAVSDQVAAAAKAGEAFGIDTGSLGLTPEEIKQLTGISLPPPSPSPESAPVEAGATATATVTGPVMETPRGPSVIPTGLQIGPDGRIMVSTATEPQHRSGIIDNLALAGKHFLDNPIKGTLDFGKGLVTDVVDGVSGAINLVAYAPEQLGLNARVAELTQRVNLNPQDYAAREELAQIRQNADELNAKQTDNLWKAAAGATLFIPFTGPLGLVGRGLGKVGLAAAGESVLAGLEAQGLKGLAARFVDRAGKGALTGGTYGYFASKGDLDAAAESAKMMAGIFGVGPAVATPIKATFGAATQGARKALNLFGQIPAVAQVRSNIYNGPIGRIWDNVVTSAEKVYEDSGLGNLLNEMYLARTEAVRLAGVNAAGMRRNFRNVSPEHYPFIAQLMQDEITLPQLIRQVGKTTANELARVASDESKRLKAVGNMLQAWAVPMHNSETKEMYNFVLRKNFMPRIIVNPEALATDPAMRATSIRSIMAKTGKNFAEAEQHFDQWVSRATTEVEKEATSGAVGRATLEARLYGLPGYSVDLPNVLDLYYQKSGRLLALHRRLGRHVANPNAGSGGDDSGLKALSEPVDPMGPTQLDMFTSPLPEAPPIAKGEKVAVAGTRGEIPGRMLGPAAKPGMSKVRVGEPGKKGKTLTVTNSKIKPRKVEPEVKPVVAQALVPETPAEMVKKGKRVKRTPKSVEPTLPVLKPGDAVLFEGRPHSVVSVSKDGEQVRLKSAEGAVQGFFRKDIVLAADRNKPYILPAENTKAPQDMTRKEFANVLNETLTAVGQTRARLTFKDLPADHPAWKAYEAGDWPTFSKEMGFSAEEIRDFRQYIRLVGGGDPSAPHYDPFDPMHSDLYDWWKSQPKIEPPAVPSPDVVAGEVRGTIEQLGGSMTIAELRKKLKAQGMTPKEIGDIVKEIKASTKAEPKVKKVPEGVSGKELNKKRAA